MDAEVAITAAAGLGAAALTGVLSWRTSRRSQAISETALILSEWRALATDAKDRAERAEHLAAETHRIVEECEQARAGLEHEVAELHTIVRDLRAQVDRMTQEGK